jgi:predicted nucleic-acid-binding protein
MRAVDTNLLVRIVTKDDTRQLEAAKTFLRDGAWVSILALAETVRVLADIYGRSSDELIATIETLLRHESLVLQDSDVVSAALDLYRMRPSLGFSDCLKIEIARKAGHLPLGTFDRAFGKVADAKALNATEDRQSRRQCLRVGCLPFAVTDARPRALQ